MSANRYCVSELKKNLLRPTCGNDHFSERNFSKHPRCNRDCLSWVYAKYAIKILRFCPSECTSLTGLTLIVFSIEDSRKSPPKRAFYYCSTTSLFTEVVL